MVDKGVGWGRGEESNNKANGGQDRGHLILGRQ